jgi:hypothetical protein
MPLRSSARHPQQTSRLNLGLLKSVTKGILLLRPGGLISLAKGFRATISK